MPQRLPHGTVSSCLRVPICPTLMVGLYSTHINCFLFIFIFFTQGKSLVTTSMKVISLIGDAVLTLTVPDEEMISIDTTEITITLGRHSTDKLAGLNIQGRDGRFVLPADKKALVSRIQEASFVDTQVDKSVFLSKMRRYEYLCYFLYDFHERVRASTNMRGVNNPPFFLNKYQASTKMSCNP